MSAALKVRSRSTRPDITDVRPAYLLARPRAHNFCPTIPGRPHRGQHVPRPAAISPLPVARGNPAPVSFDALRTYMNHQAADALNRIRLGDPIVRINFPNGLPTSRLAQLGPESRL
jgi:hypothetical protein